VRVRQGGIGESVREKKKDSQLLHTRWRRAIRSDSHVETALDWYRREDLVVGLREVEKTATTLGKVEEGWRGVLGADGLQEEKEKERRNGSARAQRPRFKKGTRTGERRTIGI